MRYFNLFRHFWIIPSLVIVLFLGLADMFLLIDGRGLPLWLSDHLWHVQDLKGAHDVVYTIAVTILTIATSTFTVTIAALSFASRDMGPRLLESFTQEWKIQLTLGVLVGTYVYCMWTMTAMSSLPAGHGVPLLTVNASLAMSMVCVGFLVFFIHHLTSSMEAATILNQLTRELKDRLEKHSSPVPPTAPPAPLQPSRCTLRAPDSGNLHEVRIPQLVKSVAEQGARVHLRVRPGDYIFPGMVVADATREVDLKPFLVFSSFRKTHHDLELPVRQLNEIAVRSLASGIKDPFTVFTCLDRFGSTLCSLRGRHLDPGVYRDSSGEVRVTVPVTTFGGLMDSMFHQIRQLGHKDPAILIRMLEIFAVLMEVLTEPDHRKQVLRHAEMVMRAGQEHLHEPQDLQDMEVRFRAVQDKWGQPALPIPT